MDHDRSAARTCARVRRWPDFDLRFTPQQSPYGDSTSVLNADTALDRPRELYVAYADNPYPEDHPEGDEVVRTGAVGTGDSYPRGPLLFH